MKRGTATLLSAALGGAIALFVYGMLAWAIAAAWNAVARWMGWDGEVGIWLSVSVVAVVAVVVMVLWDHRENVGAGR